MARYRRRSSHHESLNDEPPIVIYGHQVKRLHPPSPARGRRLTPAPPPGPQASRASRPYWLLREYGLEVGKDFFEVDTGGPVTGFNGTRDSPEFLEANPYRLIPVMVHGEVKRLLPAPCPLPPPPTHPPPPTTTISPTDSPCPARR